MIEKIKKVRENLKNPKTKSLTLLGIYAVFFIIVYILIRTGEPVEHASVVKKEIKSVSSYEFTIELNDNSTVTKTLGNYNNNSITFNVLDTGYYYQNGKYYLNGEEIEEYDLFDPINYTYSNITSLKEKGTFLEETTYSDGHKKASYNLSINDYFNTLGIYYDCNLDNCDEINILLVIEYNEYINNVSIDLSNFYGYLYQINIQYTNIN